MRELAALLWPLVVVYAIWRAAKVAELGIERFAPTPVPPDEERVEVPDDLVAVAMQESETWAQDQTMKAIRERYAEFGDWNKVRSALGIGKIL